jgi:hypothetical protein
MLYRDQVQLVHLKGKFTLRGMTYQVLDKKVFNCTEDTESPWGNAVKALEAALAGMQNKPVLARIILSNHFVRYAMIPWSESLNNEAEEIAYAKHCFSQLYGANAESWDLRINQDAIGAIQFASAIDGELLLTLRAVFAQAGVKLKSVQPHLMTAYNNCQGSFQKQVVWFVLFEQGSLCLGLVQQGQWCSVRTIKVGSDWLERLPEIIDREDRLSELDISSDEIYLWAPEHWTAALPKSERLKIHKLQPVVEPSMAHQYDARYAMAMCG